MNLQILYKKGLCVKIKTTIPNYEVSSDNYDIIILVIFMYINRSLICTIIYAYFLACVYKQKVASEVLLTTPSLLSGKQFLIFLTSLRNHFLFQKHELYLVLEPSSQPS